MTRENIFIVGSPWHAIVTLAILESKQEDINTIIVESISKSSEKQIKEIFASLKITAVYNHENTRFNSIKKTGARSFIRSMNSEYDRIKADIVRKYSTQRTTEVNVYYFNFYSPITRSIISQIKKTSKSTINLSRVEDGVCDYLPFNFIHYSLLSRAMKALLSMLIGKHWLYKRSCNWLKKQTNSYYCFFPSAVDESWKSKQLVDLSIHRDFIKRYCAADAGFSLRSLTTSSNPLCLIVGQTLFEDGICSLEDEIEIYAALAKSSHYTAIFKPHPRSSDEKISAIKREAIPILDSTLPAENIICSSLFDTIIGMWSNTIIYSSHIFEIPSLSMTHALVDGAGRNNYHLKRIHNVLISKFPEQYIDYRSSEYFRAR